MLHLLHVKNAILEEYMLFLPRPLAGVMM